MKVIINKKLFWIFCAALAIGVYQMFVVFSISGDGPVYIDAARRFYEGDFATALRKEFPPLYPVLIAIAYTISPNWIVAGKAVSLVLGFLTIFPVYFLVKKVFGEKLALITALLLVFHPFVCKYWVRVLTEGTYIFLLACSVWLSWKAITEKKYVLFFLSGVAAGLNYLNRPEGIGVFIITALFVVCGSPLIKKGSYKKRFLSLCALSAGIIILAGPYIMYMKSVTGKWQLSRKKNVAVALMGKPGESSSVPAPELDAKARIPAYSKLETGYFKTLFDISKLFVNVYYPSLFILMLIGFIRRKIYYYDLRFELYIGVLCIFYILVFSLFYASDRHLVPLVSICLFWASIGLYELNDVVLNIWHKVNKTEMLSDKRVFGFLLVGIIITLLPFTLRPQDRDKIGQKRVGKWMKENCKKSPFILTDMGRIAFYANGYFVQLQNRPDIDTYEKLVAFATRPNEGSYGYNSGHNKCSVDYIVIDKSRIGRYCPDFLDSVNPLTLDIVHVQPKLSHSAYGELVVYKVK